jgi:hypothetical protein
LFKKNLLFLLITALIIITSACGLNADETPINYDSSSASVTDGEAQVAFWAQLPAEVLPGDTVSIVFHDEVTGLPYNQTKVEMAALGNGFYGALATVKIDSVVKYSYAKNSGEALIPEVDLNGEVVRYRMYSVKNPGETHDQVAGWADAPIASQPAGRIDGYVYDAASGFPLADILVTAGGMQTFTDGAGSFTLYPLKEGKHTLVAYAIDGSYQTFQQEAIVARDSATPTELRMQASKWVNVTFIVTVPASTIEGAVMRMAGNLVQLGNTFSNLGAGISGDINQMPVLTYNGDGYYSLKIRLPAETEIFYKYTLGDGFWNSEHDANGNYITHRHVFPAVNDPILVQDNIVTWKTSQTADFWFTVTAPNHTPGTDQVSIQFQLANWMPAIPMYRIGENQWAYPLLSPQNFAGPIAYRYCRNGQCSGSFQSGIESLNPPRETAMQFSESILLNDSIENWFSLNPAQPATTLPSGVASRGDEFITGIAFSPYYTPTWDAFIEQSFSELRQMNTKMVILSPSWEAVGPGLPLLFQSEIGSSPRWHEAAHNIETAHDQGLHVALFPQMRFPGSASEWWQAADTSNPNWWLAWFEQYRDFILQYADLAKKTEAELFVLGGDWLLPALPIADNATTYSLPGSVESLWLDLIEEVRIIFPGTIAWHIPVSMIEQAPLSVLSSVDQIHLQWDTPLTTEIGNATVDQMASQAVVLMELYVQPFYELVDKPIIISLAYPSATGSEIYCIPISSSDPTCIDPTPLLQGPIPSIQPQTDLQVQANLYAAVLEAITFQDWIGGVVSQGWYPPLELHDSSASIHGKPTQNLLAEWFRLLLGN